MVGQGVGEAMNTKTLMICMLALCLAAIVALAIMLAKTRSDLEKRMGRAENRILNLTSDPIIAKSHKQREAEAFAAERLQKDVDNLQVHAYGFAMAKGRLVTTPAEQGVPVEGLKLYFRLWREEDREKSRAMLVVTTDKDGAFDMPLPTGKYGELQFGGGTLPEGYDFSRAGFPIRGVEIVRDQVLNLPPVEIVRRANQTPQGVGVPQSPR